MKEDKELPPVSEIGSGTSSEGGALSPSEWEMDRARTFSACADELFQPIYRFLIQDILAVWGKTFAGVRVAEIGGGPGHMALEWLREPIALLASVERSEAMLKLAEQRLQSVFPRIGSPPIYQPIQGCASQLPIASGSIDLLYSRGSMPFWPDLPAALEGFSRVLSPHGMAYFGGGYGYSAPRSLVQEIQKRREVRQSQGKDQGIPVFPKEQLFETLKALGGRVHRCPPGGGFWVAWWPHQK